MESFDSDESIVQAPVAAEESKRDVRALIDNDEDDDTEDWAAGSTTGLAPSRGDTSTVITFIIVFKEIIFNTSESKQVNAHFDTSDAD